MRPRSEMAVFLRCLEDDKTMVTINGKQVSVDGKSLMDYLAETGYDIRRVAVERNGKIVPKTTYGEVVLQDGDIIEIVGFVGGG